MRPWMIGGVGAVVILLMLGIWLWHGSADSETVSTITPQSPQAITLSSSTLSVPVSGTVVAAETATIYAETAGVISALPVTEGSRVGIGTLLAQQSTPVLAAQQSLAAAQAALRTAQQNDAVTQADASATTAAVQAYSASELATLRLQSDERRLAEATEQLQAALEASALTLIDALNYINTHRPLFSGDGLVQFEETVASLYGTVPQYFSGGVAATDRDPTPFLERLQAETATSGVEMVDQLTLAAELSILLDGAAQVLQTGEADVFDRQYQVEHESAATDFLAQRTAVTNAQAELAATVPAVRKSVDQLALAEVDQAAAVATAEIDREAAAAHAAAAERIAAATTRVATAEQAVVAAERSLGTVTAPFAGIVSQVLVERGEYAAPGTPLLELLGSGARELSVTVPSAVASGVRVGDVLVIDGEEVGVVDRIAPQSTNGSVTVFLALQRDLSVGATVSGELLLAAPESVYAVPRAYVHFAPNGPFLRTEDGERVSVTVEHDAGSTLFVQVPDYTGAAFVPARSIAL